MGRPYVPFTVPIVRVAEDVPFRANAPWRLHQAKRPEDLVISPAFVSSEYIASGVTPYLDLLLLQIPIPISPAPKSKIVVGSGVTWWEESYHANSWGPSGVGVSISHPV